MTNKYDIPPHTVQSGETLYKIAQTHNIPVDSLMRWNNIDKDGVIFPGQKLNLSSPNDISYSRNISDSDIERTNYIIETKNNNYVIKKGDNLSIVADKYNVSVNYLSYINNIDEGAILPFGKELKIPPTRNVKNIRSLNDVAKALGVSPEFIKNLKMLEDGKKADKTFYSEKEFHNTPYTDNEGHRTIGIGHVLKKGDKESLTNQEVLELFANDLLKMEENLWATLGGKRNYEKLPQSIKEALLDMTFNKGTDILKNSEGLIWCLKNEKYEAAINKMTNIKSLKGNEMSGLARRRLFDMATACKMYNGNIPNSNLATAQNLYKKGIELLRAEYGNKFESQLVGYNNYIKQIWGDKIKLITN